MGPEDIKKLTDAKQKLEYAERGVTSTSLEVRRPIQERVFNLRDRYEAEGIDEAARKKIGEVLEARISALLDGLWDQDKHPDIKRAFTYPDNETKIIEAEGFVPLYITKYHEEGPDADPENRPEGFVTLTDRNGFWGLHHNDRAEVAPDIAEPRIHAWLEDDVNTLEQLYGGLGLELPE